MSVPKLESVKELNKFALNIKKNGINMRAIIPVAGFGTRLKPHTHSTPKVLLNVGGKPILGHIIDKLIESNIYKTTFVIGHLGEKIEAYIRNEYPSLQADFVLQQEMLGLGHAIYSSIPTFDDDEIFIILGDTIFDVDLTNVFEKKISSLGVKEVDDPRRFGVAFIQKDRVEKLIEKPATAISKLALVGLYYISDSKKLKDSLCKLIDNNIRTKGEYQLTDALQLMIDDGIEFTTFPVEGWYDCGKPETLLATNEFLLKRNGTNRTAEGVVINHPVFIARDAVVKNCIIGPFATIGERCIIQDCLIKNSIVSSDCNLNRVMLENSIVGSNAVIKGSFKRLNAGDSSEIVLF